MAGMPLRRSRINQDRHEAELEIARLRAGDLPDDYIKREFPRSWKSMSEVERLETMLGYSLTVGMEVLCWGPLRTLTASEMVELNKVRHDVMMICTRLGIERSKRQSEEADRELADAVAKFDGKSWGD